MVGAISKILHRISRTRSGSGLEPDECGSTRSSRRWNRECKRRSPTWQRWKTAPLPIPMKTAWSAIIGCETPRSRQRRKSARKLKKPLARIKDFAAKIHAGQDSRRRRAVSKIICLIGIGGSALGPQFVAHALGDPRTDKLKPFFFDNTDPDGMDRVLATIGADLNRTLCIVISKSGGTKETRNGMLVAEDGLRAGRT